LNLIFSINGAKSAYMVGISSSSSSLDERHEESEWSAGVAGSTDGEGPVEEAG
jgi:hypothetical protein